MFTQFSIAWVVETCQTYLGQNEREIMRKSWTFRTDVATQSMDGTWPTYAANNNSKRIQPSMIGSSTWRRLKLPHCYKIITDLHQENALSIQCDEHVCARALDNTHPYKVLTNSLKLKMVQIKNYSKCMCIDASVNKLYVYTNTTVHAYLHMSTKLRRTEYTLVWKVKQSG